MRFEIYHDEANRFRWRLLTANSEMIADGGGYIEKHECERIIHLIRRGAATARVIDYTGARPAGAR